MALWLWQIIISVLIILLYLLHLTSVQFVHSLSTSSVPMFQNSHVSVASTRDCTALLLVTCYTIAEMDANS